MCFIDCKKLNIQNKVSDDPHSIRYFILIDMPVWCPSRIKRRPPLAAAVITSSVVARGSATPCNINNTTPALSCDRCKSDNSAGATFSEQKQ